MYDKRREAFKYQKEYDIKRIKYGRMWEIPSLSVFTILPLLLKLEQSLVFTKSEKILVIELKGDYRDNSDSIFKLKLGRALA